MCLVGYSWNWEKGFVDNSLEARNNIAFMVSPWKLDRNQISVFSFSLGLQSTISCNPLEIAGSPVIAVYGIDIFLGFMYFRNI